MNTRRVVFFLFSHRRHLLLLLLLLFIPSPNPSLFCNIFNVLRMILFFHPCIRPNSQGRGRFHTHAHRVTYESAYVIKRTSLLLSDINV